jgi:hypothetical protein
LSYFRFAQVHFLGNARFQRAAFGIPAERFCPSDFVFGKMPNTARWKRALPFASSARLHLNAAVRFQICALAT